MIYYVSTIGMIAVAIILVLGLSNLFKGGSASRSQMLMRMRIGVQFATVVAVMAILYLTAG